METSEEHNESVQQKKPVVQVPETSLENPKVLLIDQFQHID